MASFTLQRRLHVRGPQDFGLGVAATLAELMMLGAVLFWASHLPSRGPLAEPRAPSVTVEARPQSPPPPVLP